MCSITPDLKIRLKPVISINFISNCIVCFILSASPCFFKMLFGNITVGPNTRHTDSPYPRIYLLFIVYYLLIYSLGLCIFLEMIMSRFIQNVIIGCRNVSQKALSDQTLFVDLHQKVLLDDCTIKLEINNIYCEILAPLVSMATGTKECAAARATYFVDLLTAAAPLVSMATGTKECAAARATYFVDLLTAAARLLHRLLRWRQARRNARRLERHTSLIC